MASPKEIKNRIHSVSNTKKITRTMELVSTAKAKRSVDQIQNSLHYYNLLKDSMLKLYKILPISELQNNIFFKPRKVIKNSKVLIITSNRGLCGPFNNNVLMLANQDYQESEEQISHITIDLIGKKALSQFEFMNKSFVNFWSEVDDTPRSSIVLDIVNKYLKDYLSGELDELKVISTRYYSAGKQKVAVTRLFPFDLKDLEKNSEKQTLNDNNNYVDNYIVEPDALSLLTKLAKEWVGSTLYRLILESIAGEHIARRIAMKNATEAASDMVHSLTRSYNRVRQGKITQEIAEIVGGAAAVAS